MNPYPFFECIEIDDSYIEGVPVTRPTGLVNAIVMLARTFGLTVVNRGVEILAQLEALSEYACGLPRGVPSR